MTDRPFTESRGFTLLELSVVLLVASIVMALTGPAIIKNFGILSLKTAAKKTGGALRYSRSQAVSTGTTYNVVFNTKNSTITVAQVLPPRVMDAETGFRDTGNPEQETDSNPSRSARKREIKTYSLPDGIRFAQIIIAGIDSTDQDDGGLYQTVFFPGGGSRGGEIVLADEKDRMYRVTVNRITGVVIVAEKDED